MAVVQAIRLAVSLSEVIAPTVQRSSIQRQKLGTLFFWTKDDEVDPWINDIYVEVYPAQPQIICVPGLSAFTVVHDLKEDIVLENHLLEN